MIYQKNNNYYELNECIDVIKLKIFDFTYYKLKNKNILIAVDIKGDVIYCNIN